MYLLHTMFLVSLIYCTSLPMKSVALGKRKQNENLSVLPSCIKQQQRICILLFLDLYCHVGHFFQYRLTYKKKVHLIISSRKTELSVISDLGVTVSDLEVTYHSCTSKYKCASHKQLLLNVMFHELIGQILEVQLWF